MERFEIFVFYEIAFVLVCLLLMYGHSVYLKKLITDRSLEVVDNIYDRARSFAVEMEVKMDSKYQEILNDFTKKTNIHSLN